MKFGSRSIKSLNGVHPNLIWVLMESIVNSPVDFTITDGGRTAFEQKSKYAQGRKKPGDIITFADGYKKKSNHQAKDDGFYYAVDLYPFVNGSVDIQDKGNTLPKIAAHIKETAKRLGVSIEWGGDWKSIVDKPHFELVQ